LRILYYAISVEINFHSTCMSSNNTNFVYLFVLFTICVGENELRIRFNVIPDKIQAPYCNHNFDDQSLHRKNFVSDFPWTNCKQNLLSILKPKKMPKRLNDENLGNQSQKKVKWTLQDIEENSIDQLIAQPSPAFKETLEKLLATNNEAIASHSEKIARLTSLNEKILECLERIDEQDQKNLIGVSSKVSFLTFLFQKLNKCLEDLRE
jgi:hypothetical protein